MKNMIDVRLFASVKAFTGLVCCVHRSAVLT